MAELELAANPDAEFEDDGDEVVVKLKEKTRNRKGRGFGKGEQIWSKHCVVHCVVSNDRSIST